MQIMFLVFAENNVCDRKFIGHYECVDLVAI